MIVAGAGASTAGIAWSVLSGGTGCDTGMGIRWLGWVSWARRNACQHENMAGASWVPEELAFLAELAESWRLADWPRLEWLR